MQVTPEIFSVFLRFETGGHQGFAPWQSISKALLKSVQMLQTTSQSGVHSSQFAWWLALNETPGCVLVCFNLHSDDLL